MKTRFIQLIIVGGIFTAISCSISPNKPSEDMKMQSEITGNGMPIVLVPGGLTGWASWEPFAKTFSDNRTVIRVQLLGVQFGSENRPLPEDYSVETESSALGRTLDSLGFTMPVDIVGWSYGAFASLDNALDHPDRIRTLTLIEPPAMWVLRATEKWDDEAQRTADFMQTFKGDISEEMLAEFLDQAGLVPPGQTARNLPPWNNWVSFRRSLRMNPFVVSHQDDVERLKKFRRPTLLVKGTGSTAWLHHIIDGLSETIPDTRVVELPGGHSPHVVSRDSFLVELDKFLNEQRIEK